MTMATDAPFRASRYTTGAVILHWVIALFIALQLASGFVMADILASGSALQYDVFQLHKSMGITVLVLTVARILWRLFNRPPPEPASVARLEGMLAGLVQFLFYVLLLAVPLTGWLLISVSAVRVDTVLYFVRDLPFPDLPFVGGLDAATRALLEARSGSAHAFLAYSMLALMGLHIAGALKHQLSDGAFIGRMWVGARNGVAGRSRGALATILVPLLLLFGLVGAATVSRDTADTAAPAGTADAAVAAAPAATDVPDPPAEGANRWIVDPAASALTYAVQYSKAEVTGAFGVWDAAIVFSPDDLAGSSIDVTIDTTSARIDSTEISLQNVSGPDGFDNSAFGTARFSADTIRREGDGYVADGTLTIRGEARPQELRFDVAFDGDTARADGTLTLARLDYGIGAKSDAGGAYLGLDVTVNVALEARRAGAEPAEVAPEPAGAAPAWTIHPADSRVGYAFTFDGRTIAGDLPAFTADVRFAEDNLGGSSVRAEIDLASVTLEGRGVSLAQLKGADGLDTAAAPVAVFASDRVERVDTGFVAHGTLSVRGVSAPVSVPFTLKPEGERVIATGTARLDRKTFGFGAAADLGGPSLGPGVDITLELAADPPKGVDIAR